VYSAPTIPPYEPRDNPRWWLLDGRGVDQYVVRYSEFTEVLWNDIKPGEPAESVVKRDYWSDAYVAWSPQGSYLATMHNEGVAVWGGPNWTKVARFPHPGVKLIDFSPCEKYLVTASPQFQDNDNVNDPQCIIIWNVRTGERMRGFVATSGIHSVCYYGDIYISDIAIGSATWPVFKWSSDDKYFARMTEDTISVYETPSMGLLDKKSLKIPGVKVMNYW
jgi:translation initiation factor 3 subunit B